MARIDPKDQLGDWDRLKDSLKIGSGLFESKLVLTSIQAI